MSSRASTQCLNGNLRIVLYCVFLTLAPRLGETRTRAATDGQCELPTQESGSADVSILVQKNIRVRSDLGMVSTGDAADASGLWNRIKSLAERMMNVDEKDVDQQDTLRSKFIEKDVDVLPVALHLSRDEPLVDEKKITTQGKDVIINVSNDDENGTSDVLNVTTNSTDIKVERKVLEGSKKRHVVDSKVDVEDEEEKKANGEEASEDKGNATEENATEKNETKEEPFAQENTTVKRHLLNITRKENATHNKSQNVTITETVKTVNVASSFHIVSIYMVLFVPVMFAWWGYAHSGYQAKYYVWVLPFTLCTMSIGQDLVNQSLTMILEAPNFISAIQGFSMTIAMGIWLVCVDWSSAKEVSRTKLSGWWCVAVCFAVYQIINHLVYAMCSLSERTVMTNLSPLISLFCESIIMPSGLKPGITVGGKMALSLMAIGAVLFSLQNPDFSTKGIFVALVLLITTVPYRLAQRRFLASGPELPLSLLACIDGFVLGVPSVLISACRRIHFWAVIETSTETPVFIMLMLSITTFTGLHLSGLALLRLGTATTYLVFSNVASLVTVALGIFFFGDHAFATALAGIGLLANVGSGIWYSAEAQVQALSDPKDCEAPEKVGENS